MAEPQPGETTVCVKDIKDHGGLKRLWRATL